MRYLLYALCLSLRQRMRRPGFFAFFLLFALLLPALRVHAQNAPSDAIIRVGLVLPAEGGEAFSLALRANDSAMVEFVPADTDTAAREVAAGRWDCALILSDDYEERMARGEYEKLFTVLSGPASALDALVREPAAAAVARQAAPDIALKYLQSLGVEDASALAAARGQLADGLADGQLVHVRAETLDGSAMDAPRLARLNASRMERGCLAVALLVWIFFAATELIRLRKTPAARRLAPCMPLPALLLPEALSFLLPAFLAGALGLLAVGACDARELVALALYLSALGAAALLLGCFAPSEGILTLLIPFAATACLVLSPVLADVSALCPALAPLSRVLPVTLYLRAGDGEGAAFACLFAMTALLGAAAMLPEAAARRSTNHTGTEKGI